MSGPVRAAGGVVLRRRPGRPLEVVVVHRPAYGDWTFPKGKLEAGESERDAAVREVGEETGLHGLLGRELGSTEYVDSLGRPKTVRYWAMGVPEDEPVPAHEVDEARWLAVADAADRLSYERDRRLLERAAGVAPETALVFLVRHAKAGNRAKWDGPDELRPLTGSGRRQAEALVPALAAHDLAALVSSPYVRCVQTLEPLASACGLPLQEHDALAEGGSGSEAIRLLLSVAALGSAALSTHGDVQPEVIESLGDAGVPVNGPRLFQKGSVWEIEVRAGEPVAGRYRPPL